MKLDEIRHKVAESSDPSKYESLVLNMTLSHLGFNVNLMGVVAIYEFLCQQVNGWGKIQENLPEELLKSKIQFEEAKQQIVKLVNDKSFYSHYWNDMKNELENENRYYFTYECPEVNFLINVYNDYPKSFLGAYRFIINDIRSSNFNRTELIGTIMAYEFTLKDHTKILERRNAEKASIGRIRGDFSNYLNKSEEEIAAYIKRTSEKYEKYSTSIDELKIAKENLFNNWFYNSRGEHILFDQEANSKIADLENTYQELLRLKKPAEYWNKRASVLKNEGQGFLKWLVGLVLFGCLTLYFLLWLTPDGMLLSFINGQASAIKWSIVYVTFISLLAFGIRAVSKVMFSSFHLARDAEEREQLTYVYLALIKESAVEEKDKSLIMQSLFSRSDTGLLRDDSGPTMPGNIAEKIIQR